MPSPSSSRPDAAARREALRQVEAGVVDEAGGYLRNVIRQSGVTCEVCGAALDGLGLVCDRCAEHRAQWHGRLAERSGFVTYAVARRQSGRTMRAYKGPMGTEQHRRLISRLLGVALRAHVDCVRVLVGMPVTRWCTVPSAHAGARSGEHALHSLVHPLARGGELDLTASPTAEDGSGCRVGEDRFLVDAVLDTADHVLVIDDTWTTGANVQSATLALRAAGAGHVSSLVVARWLSPDHPPTKHLLTTRVEDAVYQADRCPWTGGRCPDGSQGVSG